MRSAGFPKGVLTVVGAYFPIAATTEERLANDDPRPSLEEPYPRHKHSVEAVRHAAAELQEKRLLLAEDVERYIETTAATPFGS